MSAHGLRRWPNTAQMPNKYFVPAGYKVDPYQRQVTYHSVKQTRLSQYFMLAAEGAHSIQRPDAV